MSPAVPLLDAALLGAASGLRAATPWGVLALRGGAGGGIRRVAPLLAAGGELLGDKLPATPSRTSPPPLIARFASGAGAGALVGRTAAGAALGAVAAGAAAFAGERARAAIGRRGGLPDPAVALVEDALAIGLALLATRRLAGGG